ncbi:hypothetical protein BARD7_00458 [Bacillus amyloliquefaciens]|nr:hypothetical protein BARD7_00458 [Bacillus amyloliquefaciens]
MPDIQTHAARGLHDDFTQPMKVVRPFQKVWPHVD